MCSERIKWIDVCKGLAIILVVLGHSFRNQMLSSDIIFWIKNFIYTFHMPLFMFLSGYVYKLNLDSNSLHPIKFLYSKIQTLAIPFILYSMMLYYIFMLANSIPQLNSILSNTGYNYVPLSRYIQLSLLGDNPYGNHLWFIYALFIISILINTFIFLYTRLSKKQINYIVLSSCAFMICIMRFLFDIKIVILYRIMYYLFFFVMGIVWNKINISKFKKMYVIISIISWLYVIIYSFQSNNDGDILIRVVTLFIILIIIDNICLLSKKLVQIVALNKFLGYLGKNSYVIYLLHQPFFCAFLGVLLIKINVSSLIICFLCTSIGVIMPLFMRYLFLKKGLSKKFLGLLGIK